jgi:Family of unknown function (DUF6314)
VIRFADFTGRWQITRQIDDRRAGVMGQFAGQAEFVADGDGLVLSETGMLSYGRAAPMRAEQRYIWRADGPGVAVFFADGRPFHWFSAAERQAHHDCPPDSYDVTYDFSAWPRWKSIWAVTGPRKEYVMQSVYERAGGAGR